MITCPHCGHENDVDWRYCASCGGRLDFSSSTELQTPVEIGTMFDEKYIVLEEIGRGGMGVVYRGHDMTLDRTVAIKVLPEQFNTDDEIIARFKKEARAMALLDHRNVVSVYAIGQFKQFHYFAMKYLEGQTVAEMMEAREKDNEPARLEPELVKSVVIQVCSGLQHAHEKGLIHRDVKPGNIMIAPDGRVTIMDFGIVKEQMGGDNLTRTGLVFGTPEYMAPEQAQGTAAPSPTTDIYALGIVAYEMLSGAPPFEGESPFSVVVKHIKFPPAPLTDTLPNINLALQAVIFKALEKQQINRYQTADEMREALEAVNVGSIAHAKPQKVPTPRPNALLSAPSPVTSARRTPAPNMPERPPSLSSPPPRQARPLSDSFDGSLSGNTRLPAMSVDLPAPAAIPAALSDRASQNLTPSSATPTPIPDDVAIVEDRPGHYRRMVTASPRREAEAKTRIAGDRKRMRMMMGTLAVMFFIGICVWVYYAL